MGEQFKKHGVPHRLISISNGEHGFGGGDPEKIDEAYEAVLPLVNRNMNQ